MGAFIGVHRYILKVFAPSKETAFFPVIQLPLIIVCFPLEGYSKISLDQASGLNHTNDPFDNIEEIKENEEQFPLLKRMNIFVVLINA